MSEECLDSGRSRATTPTFTLVAAVSADADGDDDGATTDYAAATATTGRTVGERWMTGLLLDRP